MHMTFITGRILLTASLLVGFNFMAQPVLAAAPPKSGSKCPLEGLKQVYKKQTFECVKREGKLTWRVKTQKDATSSQTTPSKVSSTTPSKASEVSWEPCSEAVLIRDVKITNQVVRGQNIEVSVDASSACAIDEVKVLFLAKQNGNVLNSFEDWAKRTVGTKASGTWSVSLGTTERTAEMKLDVILIFFSCENKASPRACIASKSPFDEYEVCSPVIRYRQCQVSRQIEIVAPVSTTTLPSINTAFVAGELYCGITNSESWDYEADRKKLNVISVLSWVFPDGEAAVWDRKWENWAEGTLRSGVRYRISSNLEYWGDIGGLPTLKLSLSDASGKKIRIDSSEFRGKTFVCKFETVMNGKTLRAEGTRLIP